MNKSINQSVNQSINQSINPSIGIADMKPDRCNAAAPVVEISLQTSQLTALCLHRLS